MIDHKRACGKLALPWSLLLAMVSLLGSWVAPWPLSAQIAPDQAAAMVLNSARKAYNEKYFSLAAERFREFLAKYASHREAPSARYGLALALLAGPQKNYNEIRDLLQAAAANKGLPEHAQALFHWGLVLRRLGFEELNIADAKPPEANTRREAARQRFEEARQRFAEAMAAFLAQAEKLPPASVEALARRELPASLEWAARARCYQAEMLLRLQKVKEAREITASFVNDPLLSKSRYRDLGRYYHGFASFLVKEYQSAKQVLGMLAPFDDPLFDTHARYLLARSNHLTNEGAEAKRHYQWVLDDYAKNKLVKNPPPDHVVRANFYLGVLLYEQGQFTEARERFAEFSKLYPNSPLRPDADLRLGFCLVQQKDFAEATKTLTPLVEKERRLSDQVLFWLGKAQVASAPDGNKDAAAYQKVLTQAQATLRQAAERAQQLAGADPDARQRRGEILLELADTQQSLKQSKEAASTYNQVLNEKLLPEREEELLQRQIAALSLAGDASESDKVCAQFIQKFAQSKNLPAVLFRSAENSYSRILAAEKTGNPKDLAKLHDDTVKHYQAITEKYPQAPHLNLARYGLGLTYYRKGELDKARQILESIPTADRRGELASVSYVLAECLLRRAPRTGSEGGSETGKVQEALKQAAELLKTFVDSQPKGPQAANALLKLGFCQQRLATVLGPPEKAKALAAARAAYDKILADSPNLIDPNDSLQPQAILERAKCLAQMNNVTGAINELQRFTEPLKNAALAPLALMDLAQLLREQNKAAEAAAVLVKARLQHEATLSKDPQRATWVALLRYHHGLALREAGNLAEARGIFEQVFKQTPNSPEAAEAIVRFGQSLKEEGQRKIDLARKALDSAKKPEETNAAAKLQSEGHKLIGDAVQFLESQAEQWKAPKVGQAGQARARMLYEAAWANRILSERDIETARAAKVQDLLKKLGPAAGKLSPAEVPLTALPLQASEKKARAQYQALIDGFPDLPLANEARLELAELYVQRHEYEPALKLLKDGLDRDPPAELSDRLRLRLGDVHAAKGDRAAALAQFDAVARQTKSPLLGQALYRAGEYLMHEKQWAEAIKRLARFRSQEPLALVRGANIPGLTDRALLLLGQAHAQVENWAESRAAYERLVTGIPNSPLLDDARYGIAWAWQHEKQYDRAAADYNQVLAAPAAGLAAKAQLQIGLCRMAQKRYSEAANALLVVPVIYDSPELSAAALLEAARAFAAMKAPDGGREQAIRLLERLLQDRALSAWAEIARERLQEMRGKDF